MKDIQTLSVWPEDVHCEEICELPHYVVVKMTLMVDEEQRRGDTPLSAVPIASEPAARFSPTWLSGVLLDLIMLVSHRRKPIIWNECRAGGGVGSRGEVYLIFFNTFHWVCSWIL